MNAERTGWRLLLAPAFVQCLSRSERMSRNWIDDTTSIRFLNHSRVLIGETMNP